MYPKALRSILSFPISKSLPIGFDSLKFKRFNWNFATVSFPLEGSKTKVSFPFPPSIKSFPGPPFRTSSPKKISDKSKSPIKKSLWALPLSGLLPVPPITTSEPFPPIISLFPPVATSISSVSPPFKTIWLWESLKTFLLPKPAFATIFTGKSIFISSD